MPRLARLPFIPFGWYYVALRSVADKRIVTGPTDLARVLRMLRRALRGGSARLHAGYVGQSEIHLALQAGDEPLNIITRKFQREYAWAFNRLHNQHGSLFRLHHRVLLFQEALWLVPIAHFIHWIRPVALTDDGYGDLWWSTDAAYRKRADHDWLTTNVLLRMLTQGGNNNRDQDNAYRKRFDHPPDPGGSRLLRFGSPEDARILGDREFIAAVWRLTGRSTHRLQQPRCIEERIEGIADVVMKVVDRFNALRDRGVERQNDVRWPLVTYAAVRSKSRARPLPMVRALCTGHVIESGIATALQAARFFGSSPTPVSARRLSFYRALFRVWFGLEPDILFSSGSDNDLGGGGTSGSGARPAKLAGYLESPERYDCI